MGEPLWIVVRVSLVQFQSHEYLIDISLLQPARHLSGFFKPGFSIQRQGWAVSLENAQPNPAQVQPHGKSPRSLHQHRPNPKPLVVSPNIDPRAHRMLHDLCGGSEEVDDPHRFPDKLVLTDDRKNLLCFNPPLIIARWPRVQALKDPRADSANHILVNYELVKDRPIIRSVSSDLQFWRLCLFNFYCLVHAGLGVTSSDARLVPRT